MSKNLKRIIQGLLFVLIIIAFIFIGTRDYSKDIKVDNDRFDEEYPNVNKDNVFVYNSASEIYTFLKNGTGLIFMGYPNNKWTGYYASILNDVAKELGISKINYYDFYEDRQNKNATYESIVLKLKDYLTTLDDETQNIYAPTFIIIKNGAIIYFDAETSITTGNIKPDAYWTELKINTKKDELRNVILNYLNN